MERSGEIILAHYWGQHASQISPAGISSLPELDTKFRIFAYCDGLWCLMLSGDENCKFVHANPTTRELKYLPLLNVRNSCDQSSCPSIKCSVSFDLEPVGALGYDSRTRDFKLLALVRFSYYDDDVDLPKDFDNHSRHLTQHKKFIYSLKTNEWKEYEEEEINCPWEWRSILDMAITCNNVCYWAVKPFDEPLSIGSFDFGDEKFRLMPYPPDNYDKVVIDFSVIDLLGSVCVVTYLRYAGTKFFRFWVWVCGDDPDGGTWKREPGYDVLLFGVERPLGVTVHPPFGVLCWFAGHNEKLVRYDYATKKAHPLYQFSVHRMKLFPHVVNNLNLNGVSGTVFNNVVSDDDQVHKKRALDK